MTSKILTSLGSLSPNKARFSYDLLASFFIAGLLSAIALFEGGSFLLPLSTPLIFIFFNYLMGIYSRNKASSILFKIFALTLSSFLTSLYIFLFNSPFIAFLWLSFSLPYFLIPRLILNATDKNNSLSYVLNKRGPVVIIGGAGYIGSHVVDLLIGSGRSVRVLDQLMYGDSSLERFKNHPNLELKKGDATDIKCLTEIMRGSSAVIHLSGLVGDPACAVDKDFTRHQNITATQLVKDVAQSMGVHRFIFSSSCSVYGVSDVEVSEDDRLNPVSLYAETKVDSEIELLKSNRDDFIVTILRFATVFGDSPRPRFDLVANLFSIQAMVEGQITVMGPDQWRPFIHVRDLAKAIILVLDAKPETVQNQIFNVGDSRLNMTLMDLAVKVKAVSKKFGIDLKVNVIDGENIDKRNYAVSFKKIVNTLNFKASMLMEDGIEEILIKFNNGSYSDYKTERYSNLSTTKTSLPNFYDPNTRKNLYAPISELGEG